MAGRCRCSCGNCRVSTRPMPQGSPAPLPELPLQYADFALWQRQWLQGQELEGQPTYWQQHMVGVPALLDLPTDRPRPAVQTFRGVIWVGEAMAHLAGKLCGKAGFLCKRFLPPQ